MSLCGSVYTIWEDKHKKRFLGQQIQTKNSLAVSNAINPVKFDLPVIPSAKLFKKFPNFEYPPTKYIINKRKTNQIKQ